MPEIKNQVTTPPPTEKLFDPPQRRRGYFKYIVALIGLLVLLGGGYFAYAMYTKPAPAPEPVVQEEPEEVKIPEGTKYYLATDQDGAETRVYKYSENSAQPDEKIGIIPQKSIFVVGKYIKPYIYITQNEAGNKLQLLDVTTARLEPLFDVPGSSYVGEVAVSADKKYLAYSRNFGSDGADGHGELWLYNLETKEQKQLGKNIPLNLYEGMNVLGWRDNDKEIIVRVRGGDGGGYSGDVYEVNAVNGEFTKLNFGDGNSPSFLFGKLSPNGDVWLYDFCATPDTAARESDGGVEDACTSGTELRTYDFGTKQIKTIYQNMRYADNLNKSSLQTFMSYIWQDDKTVVAAVPGALIGITVGSLDRPVELLNFDEHDPIQFKNNFLALDSATPGSIVFQKNGELWQVFDRVSQKIVTVNTFDRKERILDWLD